MNTLENIEFLNKWYFILLLIVPFLVYFFYKKQSKWINFIFLNDLKKVFRRNCFSFYVKIVLFFLILINFILILANPNLWNATQDIKKNGIDIVVVLDISGSMKAEDLSPNRIESAKKVINDFIWNLKTDRLWLVVFAWKPFTSIPLTFDYNILTETISRLTTDNINQYKNWLNGTAIWDAILMWKTLFKAPKNISEEDYKKREKVIILLTDWDANVWVDPTLAWLSAKDQWIKIYTIGIWSEKWWTITYDVWWFKRQQMIPPLNDAPLRQIAKDTWWKFFRADNNKTFEEIFKELQKLQKQDLNIEVKKEYKEYYQVFLYSLIVLLGLFIIFIFRWTEINNKN